MMLQNCNFLGKIAGKIDHAVSLTYFLLVTKLKFATLDGQYPFVQVVGKSASNHTHDENKPMHIQHGMKSKHKQDKSRIDKNQNSRCFHMVETYINQQMMDVPAIRFEWRCTPHYPSNEHA